MIELGRKMRDTVSGFAGVAMGQTVWLNGCVRVCLQPPVDKDGKLPEEKWFDEPQVEIVEDSPAIPAGARDTGGPLPSTPRRNPDPRR